MRFLDKIEELNKCFLVNVEENTIEGWKKNKNSPLITFTEKDFEDACNIVHWIDVPIISFFRGKHAITTEFAKTVIKNNVRFNRLFCHGGENSWRLRGDIDDILSPVVIGDYPSRIEALKKAFDFYSKEYGYILDGKYKIIKRGELMINSEKVKELLSFGHIVKYDDGEDKYLIYDYKDEQFISYDLEEERVHTLVNECLDSDKNPKIEIAHRKLKQLKEGEKYYNLSDKEIHIIEKEEEANCYETDRYEYVHISEFAPLWYNQKKTVMTIEEIEEKLNLTSGSLRIKKDN